ncbi:MAG: hemolysin family protein [Maricaulaceae bacterium]
MEDTSSPLQDDETPLRRNWLSRLFKNSPSSEANTTQAQARETMINAADRFHVLRVEDVMVPRANIVAVDQTCGLHELSIAFQAAGHSRMPVYKETLDDPVGMVHIKDILSYLMLNARGRSAKTYKDRKIVPTIKRTVLYVPPSMLAQDLLRRMQARRIHMAIVVDEYGGTDGIVTLEDLVEPIVGDIEDEHDEDDAEVKTLKTKMGVTYWEADARVSIDDFEAVLGRDFASPDEEDDVDTLGGLVFTLAGRVPERGEIIHHSHGIEFEVIDADPRRVKRLRISVSKAAKSPRAVQ